MCLCEWGCVRQRTLIFFINYLEIMQMLRKSTGAKVENRFRVLAQFYVLEQPFNHRFIFPVGISYVWRSFCLLKSQLCKFYTPQLFFFFFPLKALHWIGKKMQKKKEKKCFPIGVKKQTNNNNKKEETNKSNKNYSHPIGWLQSCFKCIFN